MKNELKLNNCIVAFIDILGATNAIQNNAQESIRYMKGFKVDE